MYSFKTASLSLALYLLSAAAAQAAMVFTFDTLPSGGVITGPAGSTIGWGYTLTNQSLDHWLVLNSLDAGIFGNASTNALFDLPVVAPNSTTTVVYQAGVAGLFELTWDLAAPFGFVNSGDFGVEADWYDGDPFTTGAPVSGFTGVRQTTAYFASVSASPVPEPATWGLAAVAVVLMAVRTGTKR